MPEYIPYHSGVSASPAELESFLQGYLACAEWLARDENGEQLENPGAAADGWHRSAVKEAREECRQFMRDNRENLAAYEAESGRDMESAGHDFWLSREGHGAGYFDRGNAPCFRALQDAARSWGEVGSTIRRGLLRFDTGLSNQRRPDAWSVSGGLWGGRREFRTKREAIAHRREVLKGQPETVRKQVNVVPCFDGARTWES